MTNSTYTTLSEAVVDIRNFTSRFVISRGNGLPIEGFQTSL